MAPKKEAAAKYVSVIPRARAHCSPDQVFLQEAGPRLAAAFPSLSRGE